MKFATMVLAPIVSIPLPECRAKFLSDSEELHPILGRILKCQTICDHLQLLFSPNTSSPTGPIFHLIVYPTLLPSEQSGNDTPALIYHSLLSISYFMTQYI